MKNKDIFLMLCLAFYQNGSFKIVFLITCCVVSVCPPVTFYSPCSPKLGAISMKFVKRYFWLKSFQFYASEGPFKWR